MTVPNPFEGDGRQMVEPTASLPGTNSWRIRRSTMRLLAQSFDRSGHGSHSPGGSTLWVILLHCHLKKIPYRVSVQMADGRVCGYFIERIGEV